MDKLTERLIPSDHQLRYVMDKMLEGAQIISFDWRYLYVNDALEVQAKCRREELLGKTMMEQFPGIDASDAFTLFRKCMQERTSYHLENEFIFPDGSKGWFELSIQPVPEGIFILSIDVTERKRAQIEIMQLNHSLERTVEERTRQLTAVNKELEAFTYSVSHNLRAPLRIINGYANILEQEHTDAFSKECARLLTVIQDNTKRMGQLIDDLLAFSRAGRGEVVKTTIDMKALVEDVWQEQAATSARAQIKIGDLYPVQANRALIAQAVANLVSNAIKYSAREEAPIIEVSSYLGDGEVTYLVRDNGTGFDMRYADKLFGVFHRLHTLSEFEGTGVGLAIAQRIIHAHGGRVWADAVPGEGATFFFTLPE